MKWVDRLREQLHHWHNPAPINPKVKTHMLQVRDALNRIFPLMDHNPELKVELNTLNELYYSVAELENKALLRNPDINFSRRLDEILEHFTAHATLEPMDTISISDMQTPPPEPYVSIYNGLLHCISEARSHLYQAVCHQGLQELFESPTLSRTRGR